MKILKDIDTYAEQEKWLLATSDPSELLWLAPDGNLTDSCYIAIQCASVAEAVLVNSIYDYRYIIENHLFY